MDKMMNTMHTTSVDTKPLLLAIRMIWWGGRRLQTGLYFMDTFLRECYVFNGDFNLWCRLALVYSKWWWRLLAGTYKNRYLVCSIFGSQNTLKFSGIFLNEIRHRRRDGHQSASPRRGSLAICLPACRATTLIMYELVQLPLLARV